MGLSDEERDRLADVVRLQPTKNSELGDCWGMEGGSEVHQYLEEHLSDYYYRDENSYIRATPEAADLVDVAPGVEGGEDGPSVVRVPELQARVFDVVAGADERSQSVVSTLHDLRDEYGVDPAVEEVRNALKALKRKDVVEVEYRAVPTYRRATDAEGVTVEAVDSGAADRSGAGADGSPSTDRAESADSRSDGNVLDEGESEFERDRAR
ncbi:MAG: DUF5797 family protein [Haloferacaceae archaeon]